MMDAVKIRRFIDLFLYIDFKITHFGVAGKGWAQRRGRNRIWENLLFIFIPILLFDYSAKFSVLL